MNTLILASMLAAGLTLGFPSPEEAEADLRNGTPKIVVSSGVAGRPPLSAHVDAETGLPLQDTGCIAVAEKDYNDIVRAWIRKHGLPRNSLKSRFVDATVAYAALGHGKAVPKTGPVAWPDGRRAVREGASLRLFAAGATAPTMTVWGATGDVTVAFGAGHSAFVRVTQPKGPVVLHVDLEKQLILQRY